MVGSVPVGGDAPISVQTMTNTPTEDAKATIDQIRRCVDDLPELQKKVFLLRYFQDLKLEEIAETLSDWHGQPAHLGSMTA